MKNVKFTLSLIMSAVILFGIMKSLASCDSPKYVDGGYKTPADIIYIKDTRTELCFAIRRQGVTCVPCNEEVEKLIEQGP